MSVKAYCREDLALQHLETALALFAEGKDYGSVITLAGAADEVFGKFLLAEGKESSLESLKQAVAAIHLKLYGESTPPKHIADRANKAKNTLKHWDKGDDMIVKFDLLQESKDMLSRAIDNYWILKEDLTPAMEKFEREVLRA
jgi:hypothetical protein